MPDLPVVEALAPGKDLVLEVPVGAWAGAAPVGTLLDDFLTREGRLRAESQARASADRFRERIGGVVVHGVDLAEIWAIELLATVFLPGAVVQHALPLALEAYRVKAIDLAHFRAPLGDLVGAVARQHGVHVDSTPSRASQPPATAMTARDRARGWAEMLGLPSRVAGGVVCLPYWNLEPVVEDLLMRSAHRPAGWPALVPGAPRVKLSSLVHGGWVGWPGRRARLRSREAVSRALDEVTALQSLEPHDRAAVAMLRQRALDTVAEVGHARSALGGGAAQLLLLAWDSAALPQTFLAAARDVGTPSLVVQHGFDALLGDTDKLHADVAAVWSVEDKRSLVDRGRRPDTVSLTGNPAADLRRRSSRVSGRKKRVLVLPEYASRLSLAVDARITFRHVVSAIRCVKEVCAGWAITIRPHPGDNTPEIYSQHFAETGVEVDTTSSIGKLLDESAICVGALSTATLQAVTQGVPAVFLDLGGIRRPAPFAGGAEELPVARSEDELLDTLRWLREVRSPPGEEGCRRALGMVPDARDRVLNLVEDLCTAGSASRNACDVKP